MAHTEPHIHRVLVEADELAALRARRAALRTATEIVREAQDALDTLTDGGVDSPQAVLTRCQILTLLYDFRQFASARDALLESGPDRYAIADLLAEAGELEGRLRALEPRPLAVRLALEHMLDRVELALQPGAPIAALIESALDLDFVPGMLAALESIYALDLRDLDAIESVPDECAALLAARRIGCGQAPGE